MTTRLGRYELAHVMGVGGSGVVYNATLRGPGGFERPVALKVLTRGHETLRREARLGGLLRHRNLVDVYEISEDGGRWFCAMELCPEGSLARRLPLPPRAVVEVGLQVCAALHYAHEELGLVHLDLKPDNLLLSGDTVKVADLGIARAVGFEGDGRVRGTRGYMPPEQAHGDPVDARSDLYALGATLVELATGVLPSLPSDTMDLGSLDDGTEPAPSHLDAVPAWLAPAVERCLHPDPDDRWPDTATFAEALRSLDVDGPGLREALGLPDELPAWTPRGGTNLSGAPELFGRDHDLAELGARLATPCLVTLKGPAGAGKSRLATAAAWAWRSTTGQQAWFCDLAEVRDEPGLVGAVARALGVPLGAGNTADHVDRLGHTLRARGALALVLDNYEQITHLAHVVARWRVLAPEARLLVTSRQALRLDGEEVRELGPLDPAGATALLVARARERGVEIAEDPDLPELVARVDGLPLALELAAGRLGVLSIRDLLDRWDLSLLRRGTDDRHGALRTALDASWSLLAPADQRALAQLSAFEGGFTPVAAEAVIAEIDRAPVDALAALLDLSLVHRVGSGRLRLLVGVHEYAAERLAALDPDRPGAAERAAHTRHAAHFAQFGEASFLDGLLEHGGHARRVALVEDLDNVLAAARRSVDLDDPPLAVRAALAAYAALDLIGPLSTAIDVLERALTIPGLSRQDANALRIPLSATLKLAGRPVEAEEHARAAMAVALETGDQRQLAKSQFYLAMLAQQRGRMDEARQGIESAVALARTVHDRRLEAAALGNLGTWFRESGDPVTARRIYETACDLHHALGDVRAVAMVRRNIGVLLVDEGQSQLARVEMEAAAEGIRAVGDRRWEGICACDLGWIHLDLGELEPAAARFDASYALAAEVGEVGQGATVRNNLGLIHLMCGRLDEARAAFQDAVDGARAIGIVRTEGIALGNLGQVARIQGRPDLARDYLLRALEIHRGMGFTYGQPYWLGALALLDSAEGHFDEACALAASAVEIAAPFAAVRTEALVVQARVELAAGHLEAARAAVDRAAAMSRKGYEAALQRAADAVIAVAEGRPDAADRVAAVRADPLWYRPGGEVARILTTARPEVA